MPTKKKLLIALYTRGTPFDGDSVESKGLGGSESALLYIARELAHLGHRVTVFCNCENPGTYQQVEYHSAENFIDFCEQHPQDICVFSRFYEALPQANATVKILWFHDFTDIKFYTVAIPVIDRYIDKYFLIGNWQKQRFTQAYTIADQKLYLTRNGIDLKLFGSPVRKDPNKLIYINTPFRGLDVLIDIFPQIQQEFPDIQLHVYSGMSLYGDDENTELQNLFEKARQQKNIFIKPPVPKPALAKELMSSRLSVYPSHFKECCSIASLECQAAGTPMITSALAGLNDTIIDNVTGILIPVDNPDLLSRSGQYQQRFLEQTRRLLNDHAAWEKLSTNARQHMFERYSWKTIASEWLEEFHQSLQQQRRSSPTTPANEQEITTIATHYLEQSAHTQALEQYRHLCRISPENAQFWHMRSALCGMLREFDEAVTCCEKALILAPNTAAIYANYASALMELQRYDDAMTAFKQALILNPGDLASIINQGKLYIKMGNQTQAQNNFKNVLRMEPDNIEALNELGQSYFIAGEYTTALNYYLNAIKLCPEYAIAQTNAGAAYMQSGRYPEAENHFKKSLRLNPDLLVTYCNLGYLQSSMGNYDLALDYYDQALLKNNTYEAAISGKAVVLERLGEFSQATKLLTPYINEGAYSDNTALVYGRMLAEQGQPDKAITFFEALIEKTSLTHELRIQANYSLGKLNDKSGAYDEAYSYYRTANNLCNKTYNREAQDQFTDAIIRTFNRQSTPSMPTSSNSDSSIIFILGMPRSGTTLVEQTLSAHTDIYGAGELTHIKNIAETITKKSSAKIPYLIGYDTISQEILDESSYAHSELLQKLSDNTPYITDKMPSNFHFLGYIESLFPNAKILHCVRNPIDTCLSCYFQYFSNGQDFSYSLSDLAHYYNAYERLMQHWKTHLQIPVLDVHYEDMIANHEETSRKIFGFLNIEWSDSCLDFHQTRRKVTTASYNQVRKPIYKSSVNKWENYRGHIKTLIDSLNTQYD